MKPRILTTALLLATISLITPVAVKAQNPPAKTYQTGPWQPVARVKPNSPVRVTFVNLTGLSLEYGLSTSEAPPRKLSPNGSAILSNFSLPAYILINPVRTTRTSLRYNVAVSDTENMVTVQIRQVSNDISGDTTLNINETGAIYIY